MTDEIVWVVSKGSYSDYRVLTACPTEKDAKTLAKRVARDKDAYADDARVEALSMVSGDVDKIVILRLSANIWDDGTVNDERDYERVEWPFDTLYDGDNSPVRWRWVRAPMHQNKGGRLEVSGTDHERVRRVFSERSALIRTDDAFRAKREVQG